MYKQSFFSAATGNDTSGQFEREGGAWSYQANVTGTGAVSATVTIQGSNNGTNWNTIGSAISLSGTGSSSGWTNSIVPWLYHRAVISSITGTGATITCVGVGL